MICNNKPFKNIREGKNLIKGKIAIIGTGFVGSTIAYTMFLSGLVSEIVLVDINKNKAEGDAMDLNHGMPFVSPVKVTAGDYSLIKDADMVIITAGANQKEGETRIDLLNIQKHSRRNKQILYGRHHSYGRDKPRRYTHLCHVQAFGLFKTKGVRLRHRS